MKFNNKLRIAFKLLCLLVFFQVSACFHIRGVEINSSKTQGPEITSVYSEVNTYSVLTSTGSFETYQWYLDDVLIPGATSAQYNAVGEGNYKVVATKESVSYTSLPKYVQEAGLRIVPDFAPGTIWYRASRDYYVVLSSTPFVNLILTAPISDQSQIVGTGGGLSYSYPYVASDQISASAAVPLWQPQFRLALIIREKLLRLLC